MLEYILIAISLFSGIINYFMLSSSLQRIWKTIEKKKNTRIFVASEKIVKDSFFPHDAGGSIDKVVSTLKDKI